MSATIETRKRAKPASEVKGVVSLDDAIRQAVNLGEKDPLSGAKLLMKRNGDGWVSSVLLDLAEDLIAERFRQVLASERRSVERILQPGAARSQAEIKLRVMPVLHEDGYWEYPAFGSATREQVLRRAAWYRGMERSVAKRADWLEQVAGMMVAEGVATVGALTVDLPAFDVHSEPFALPEAA